MSECPHCGMLIEAPVEDNKIGQGEKIKCCPFCGMHGVNICRTNPYACWIECCQCLAQAEVASTREDAIANWNRRYYDDEQSTVIDDRDSAE